MASRTTFYGHTRQPTKTGVDQGIEIFVGTCYGLYMCEAVAPLYSIECLEELLLRTSPIPHWMDQRSLAA